MRPEGCAVLADAPALALETAVAQRRRQRLLRQSAATVFFGIEAGKAFTDNLVGSVALEPLRTGVPAGDGPVRIEHVDGIVGDGIAQQTIAAIVGFRREKPSCYSHAVMCLPGSPLQQRLGGA